MNADERLAAIERDVSHILSAVSELRADVKANVETYISKKTFDAIYESARREIEASTRQLREDAVAHCADVDRRLADAERHAENAVKKVDALAEKYNARAWGILAKLIGTAILAIAAYFFGVADKGQSWQQAAEKRVAVEIKGDK